MPATTEQIKELREKTGAGIMECKRALEEGGSMDQAEKLLKEWGVANAAKRAGREAGQGIIDSEELVGRGLGGQVDGVDVESFAAAAAFGGALPAGAIDEDAAHGLGRGGEEVARAVPALRRPRHRRTGRVPGAGAGGSASPACSWPPWPGPVPAIAARSPDRGSGRGARPAH